MERKYVNYVIEDEIAIVTIDRPPMNTFDAETREELGNVLDELSGRLDEVRVAILTGAGEKAFVSGADIKFLRDRTGEQAKVDGKRAIDVFLKLEEFEVPVICAIRGYCLGGGLELAMCCDLRVATEEAKFGQPEVNLGIIPGAGGTQRLPRLVGAGRAKEMVYTGKFITAEEAQRIGLINRVVSGDRLLDEAREMAKTIATKGPLAIKAAKKAINRGLNMTLVQSLQLERDYYNELMGTEDKLEGTTAFIEKRKAVFKGK